jgi:outer membrane receptor for ferrienterochelin and colicins
MKYFMICAIICMSFYANSQISGRVFYIQDNEEFPISGAIVRCKVERCSQQTDHDGRFKLNVNHSLPDTLSITYFGYKTQYIYLQESDSNFTFSIQLFEDTKEISVEVEVRRKDTGISKLRTLQVQVLNEGELKKAACCNISESFETNASVDVNVTDAVSGAKRIQMMGLDGVYTQLQMENIPFLRGIEASFGLSAIPGPWVESIQITKGVGNVVNGYESMAGLVNFEFKKPDKMDKLYINSYLGAFGRSELNVLTGGKISKKWGSALFIHAAVNKIEVDFNKDKFRDQALTENYSIHNRWNYEGKKFEAQFGITGYIEKKEGGQLGFKQGITTPLYGYFSNSNHAEIFAKTGFRLPSYSNKSLGIIYNLKIHETKAGIGLNRYYGTEKRGYINAIFDIGNEQSLHYFKIGTGATVTDLKQVVDSIKVNRLDVIPGIFAEYSLRYNRLNAIFGVRYDYHLLFGQQFTPRIHGKYAVTTKTDLRYSAGKGFRIPNVYIDHLAMRTTSRAWNVDVNVQPEVSWNGGTSLQHEFNISGKKSTITSDYYYTWFQNQLIMDFDKDPNQIYFRNQKGASFSHAWQTELSIVPVKNMELRFVYKMLQVQAKTNEKFQQQTLVPIHRGMVNLSYKTRNKKWQYDATVQFYGKSRLPINRLSATTYTSDTFGKGYARINAQLTRTIKKWEIYVGGENLSNVKQQSPIIDAANPFGNYFDATRVWGPIIGIYGYIGVRFSIKHEKI